MEEILKFIRFRTTADRGWAKAWQIYEEAFPRCERRGAEDTRRALADPAFVAEGVWLDEELVALCFGWLYGTWCYVEYLAVAPERRNLKAGSRILAELLRRHERVVLEIEPPEDEITIRRRCFYERMGFFLNDYPYIHPSYSRPFEPHRLMLMSSGGELTPAEARDVADFVRTHVLRYTEHENPTQPTI